MAAPTPLPKTGAPARAALAAVGIRSLDDLEGVDLDGLLGLHGVGPKAVRVLRAALAERAADA
ncbi:DNA-binding protein [Herbiconiux sp. CPCC 203407]|uniref:DNA-binding protein n=1 Tax=Herbiconiux oxytropis TaxID=2970915 RepID=A0AA42BUX2_9MICO|nr:DNA-binding protein [Herbiconiux oxytropis]MCS5721761.1 DNA-binding protein [Herbiconiux oxytropis]MCS5727985.1 DNA-binding protein [Herbiconiux oxytropis]